MRRRHLILILAGAALAGLLLPGAAAAGTYSWSMPASFTATGAGANPDRDSYGARPWSYVEGGAGSPLTHSHDPSSFTPLPQFATGVRGGLAGWTDPADPGALVAANPTTSTLSDGTDTFRPSQLVLAAPSDRVVALGWTSPLAHQTTVAITGSVNPDGPVACYSWSLEENGLVLARSTGDPSGTISTTATVAPGASIYLIVDPVSPGYQAGCATAGVALNITAQETRGPSLTLARPGQGATVTDGRPVFSGTADTGFGATKAVEILVFRGASARGTPVQIMFTGRSSTGAYTLQGAPLPDGTYTAQAEQGDLSSPPDYGFSQAHTFVMHYSGIRAPLVGSALRLTPTGTVQLAVGCPAPPGVTCRGDVLVLTMKSLRTVPGGPLGRVRLLFAYVAIPGGGTVIVRRPLPAYVGRALARTRGLRAAVMVQLSHAPRRTVFRTLRPGP